MARPSWNNIADSDIDLDSPGKTTDVFQYLRDNAAAARITIFGVYLPEDSTALITWDEHAYTFLVWLPDVGDYPTIQRRVYIPVQVKVSGSGTAHIRLEDDATATTGGEQTSTSPTYETKTLQLDLDASWKGTLRTINLDFKVSGGSSPTCYVQSEERIDARLEY
jgi:hypothetical protein